MCDHPKIQVPENAINFQKYYFPYKKTASKCVIIRDFSKSQKMLSKLYQVSEASHTKDRLKMCDQSYKVN